MSGVFKSHGAPCREQAASCKPCLLPEGPFVHSFAGYQTRGCSQPNEVNFTLKMLVSAVPVGLILLGLLLFKLYPIDEEKRRENKKALQDLR